MTKPTYSALLNFALAVAAIVSLACGPELTDLGTVDVTGIWSGRNSVGVITDIRLELVQDDDGTVTGSWSGKATPPASGCPPELGPSPANVVTGTTTITEVRLDILGAGVYSGNLVATTVMRGSLLSCGQHYPLEFQRVSASPPP